MAFARQERVCFFPGAWHTPEVLPTIGFPAPEGGKAGVLNDEGPGQLLQFAMCWVQIIHSVGYLRRCTRWAWYSFSSSIVPGKDGDWRNERQPAVFEHPKCLTAGRI